VSTVDRYAERIRRVPPIVADAALAVAILVLNLIEVLFFREDAPPFDPRGFLIFAVLCLGLVARRRYVWITYGLLQVVAVGALFGHVTVDVGFLIIVILSAVVVYSVAERAPGWVAALAAMSMVGDIWLGDLVAHQPPLLSLLKDAIYWTLPFSLAAFAGWSRRRRGKLTAQLEVRAEDVRREQERVAEQAVARERIQIAHELRALVSEGVERMTGQARRARLHLEVRSVETQQGISAIELTGRRTLVEMRRLLLVLRRTNAQHTEGASPDLRGVDDELEGRAFQEIDDGIQPAFPRLRWWLRRPWVVDWCVVLLLSAFMAGEFIVYGPDYGKIVAGWLPKILAAVILSSLLVRRRSPFSVLCLISVAVFLWILFEGDIPGTTEQSLLVAIFTVAAYKKPRWAVAAVALALLSWSPIPARHRCLCLVHIGSFALLATLAGVAIQAGRKINRELERLTDAMVRTRSERVRLALVEERTRVAREMHDLVAHSMTAMVVQAGAARMVAETDPALAEENLEQIEETGVDAMRELEILNATLDPASTILERDRSGDASDVRVLVDRFRRTGQAVHLVEEGERPPVDQGLQISVYRIVQEALTNVQKHARGAPTTVSIRYQPGGIEIEVANSAATTIEADTVPGAGQGLVGIHERASVFGGTAEAGPTLDGGFRVYAHLPVELVSA
jgi:signal transduction histidine kinase